MTLHMNFAGGDPRQAMSVDDLNLASLRAAPMVARPARGSDGMTLALGVLGSVALGALTLMALWRGHDPVSGPAPTRAQQVQGAPIEMKTARLAGLTSAAQITRPVTLAASTAVPAPASGGAIDPNQSRANPMIVDNTAGGETAAGKPASPAAAGSGGQPQPLLSADEQFVGRLGADGQATSHATGLSAPAYAVVQGTVIAAVLETALNSDLPGYARAIVSRDVRGFDGQHVVIPRGSRLIGQYKSGLATGQSRAFIVWTRLIRPDGASITLGSPVMDEAGETGLSGKVNRHFLQRYGSAVMLSVVGGLAGSLGDSSNTLVIGTSAQAQSAAAQALQTDGRIGPTVRVPQGTPIQVFTARDLDFSGV